MTAPTKTTYNDGLISRELSQLGFREVNPETAYRVVACTTAPEKCGKTHWALTAPAPIAAIATDTGTEEIAKKFLAKKRIIIVDFKDVRALVEDGDKSAAQRQWKRLEDAFKKLVDTTKIRTIVADTATEMWELKRLAAFGKLTQVLPHHYTQVNAEFTALVKEAYNRLDLNVIFVHKQKKQYKTNKDGKDAWTGKWERAGFGDLPYLVDVNLNHYFNRETKEFGVGVIDSRVNMVEVVGQQMEGVLCGFEDLAYQMFPETLNTERWK